MKSKIEVKDLRQFGMVLALVFALFAFLYSRKGHENACLWLAWFSAVSVAAGIVFPIILTPVFRAFTKIAHALGWFNTRVILVVVYYLILTPIGLLLRVLGKDLLDIRIERGGDTYWRKREITLGDSKDLEKQF